METQTQQWDVPILAQVSAEVNFKKNTDYASNHTETQTGLRTSQ